MKSAPLHRIQYGEGVIVIVAKYDLKSGQHTVGTVEMETQGRYYCIRARYCFRDMVPMRLVVKCGEKQIDLGMCVQYLDDFGTERRLPINQLGEGKFEFHLLERNRFVPVKETQPFEYLDAVTSGRFEVRSGVRGIILKSQTEKATLPLSGP